MGNMVGNKRLIVDIHIGVIRMGGFGGRSRGMLLCETEA
jgi:hypothetical protein